MPNSPSPQSSHWEHKVTPERGGEMSGMCVCVCVLWEKRRGRVRQERERESRSLDALLPKVSSPHAFCYDGVIWTSTFFVLFCPNEHGLDLWLMTEEAWVVQVPILAIHDPGGSSYPEVVLPTRPKCKHPGTQTLSGIRQSCGEIMNFYDGLQNYCH